MEVWFLHIKLVNFRSLKKKPVSNPSSKILIWLKYTKYILLHQPGSSMATDLCSALYSKSLKISIQRGPHSQNCPIDVIIESYIASFKDIFTFHFPFLYVGGAFLDAIHYFGRFFGTRCRFFTFNSNLILISVLVVTKVF